MDFSLFVTGLPNVVHSLAVKNQTPSSTPPHNLQLALHKMPQIWQLIVLPQLGEAEHVHAWLQLNLDGRLHFAEHLLVITNQRLLHFDAVRTNQGMQQSELVEYLYRAGLSLSHYDHAGVGNIELLDGDVRKAHWFYTLANNTASTRFIKQFELQMHSVLSGKASLAEIVAACPTCQSPLSAEEECPQCSRNLDIPPSTWTLFRLWRFAKPYQWQLLAGFLLMLASTAATLVPPYLTIPLMDKVLIPYQNGAPIDIGFVTLLL